ncbi:MAG: hypothetical protein JXR76_29780 [Deltaproteobacteria bacterium]|nr:hypothetical protein [Deltaproteobacteria bacterium]
MIKEGNEGVKFNKGEIGKVALKLNRICYNCRMAVDCPVFTSGCPVGMSRKLLNTYAEDERQIIKDVDLSKRPLRPPGAVISDDWAREILTTIPQLCNKCMFHSNNCFLNIIYAWMEAMLRISPGKPVSERPDLSETKK